MTRAARLVAPVLAVAFAAACSPVPGRARARVAEEPSCLTIGAWSDLHGQIDPDHPVVDTGITPAGGVVALADAISDLRDTHDAVILLDGGDLFSGPLESNIAEGAPIIDAYRVIGVDAAALGNHEFDFGPIGPEKVVATKGAADSADGQGPRGALMARMASASFPFVSANVRRKDGSLLGWPNFAASTRIRRGGFDVGIVGYTTRETSSSTVQANVVDLELVTNAAASVAAEIHRLRASGAAPIVLLAHAGLDGELPQSLVDPSGGPAAAPKGELASLLATLGVDRPDVVIGGHRHAWLLGRVAGVPTVSTDQHGIGLARIRFCRVGGGVELQSIERRVNLAATPPRTALGRAVATAMVPWKVAVKALAERVVTTVPEACAIRGLEGTALEEQVARAVLSRASDVATPPKGVALVGLTNAGGLRVPLARGPLTYARLFAALPFENMVCVCETTRAGLARMIDNALTQPSVLRHFPFALAGAVVVVERSADGALARARLDINGSATDESPVWVAMPDFVLDGGDGFLKDVACSRATCSSTRLRDAWEQILVRDQGKCDGPPRNIKVRGLQ